MSKIQLSDVNGGYDLSRINDNFSKIETELNTKVLYRDNPDGEPNTMSQDLDMNGNEIYNVAKLTADELKLGGVVVVPEGLVVGSTPDPESLASEPTSLDGNEVWSMKKASVWVRAKLSNIGKFVNSSLESYGGDPTGVNNSGSALAAIPAGTLVRIPSGTWKISTNTTVACNIEMTGGVFSISPGVTLTFTGTFKSELYKCFTGSGSVVLSSKTKSAHPEWFGARDGTNTDGAAIRKCLDACRTNKVTTWFTSDAYLAEPGSDLSVYTDSPIMSTPKSLINSIGATSGFSFKEGNYGGGKWELPSVAQFSAYGLRLENVSLLDVRIPSIAVVSSNNAIEMAAVGAGKTVLDNKIECLVISQIAQNAIIVSGTHADNVIQGNEFYVNFATSIQRAVLFFASGVSPNWDSNKFVFQAIDPTPSKSGATGLENNSPAAVPRVVFRCETWFGGFPTNGAYIFGAFDGLDAYVNFAESVNTYGRWGLTGTGNTVRTGYAGPSSAAARLVASNTANARASFNGGVPVDYQTMRCRITLASSVATGAIYNAYVYHLFSNTDQMTFKSRSANGTIPNVIGTTANANEILIQIMNVSGATLSAGTNIDFDLTVGIP